MNWFTINPKIVRSLTDVTAWHESEHIAGMMWDSLIFRPIQMEDVELILAMHQRSSERTIYSRYHSPRVPTRHEVSQICQLDGQNGRAVVATTSGKKPTIVGLAYYINADSETAEIALLVEDRYQGQGVGKQLLHQLRDLAIAQGICFFEAFVLPTNKPMFHLLYQTGQVVQNKLVYGAREIRIQLTAVTPWEVADEWMIGKEPERLPVEKV